MTEGSTYNRQNAFNSINCARDAWSTLSEYKITETDAKQAKNLQIARLSNEDFSSYIGQNIDQASLCEAPFLMRKIYTSKQRLDEIFEEYIASGSDPFKVIVHSNTVTDILEHCLVKRFYEPQLEDSAKKLFDVFDAYNTHLQYSKCPDHSAIESLQILIGSNFSMLSYEEAKEEIGKIMDAEDAAHIEL